MNFYVAPLKQCSVERMLLVAGVEARKSKFYRFRRMRSKFTSIEHVLQIKWCSRGKAYMCRHESFIYAVAQIELAE